MIKRATKLSIKTFIKYINISDDLELYNELIPIFIEKYDFNDIFNYITKHVIEKDNINLLENIFNHDVNIILSCKVIKYLIIQNKKHLIQKLLLSESRIIHKCFDHDKIQKCIMTNIRNMIHFVSIIEVIRDEKNLQCVLFYRAIIRNNLDSLRKITNYHEFMTIEHLCNCLIYARNHSDIVDFLCNNIVCMFDKDEIFNWILGYSNYKADDTFYLVRIVIDNIDKYIMILRGFRGEYWKEFIVHMKKEFDEDKVRQFAKKNKLMIDFGYVEFKSTSDK